MICTHIQKRIALTLVFAAFVHTALNADDMMLDFSLMQEVSSAPGVLVTAQTQETIQKYAIRAGVIGSVIYAYKRGRGALRKDISEIREILERLEKEQQHHERLLRSVKKKQEEHTEYLHDIRTEVRSLRGHQEKRFNAVDNKLGELDQKADAQRYISDEILSTVREHKEESGQGMVALARLISERFSQMANRYK